MGRIGVNELLLVAVIVLLVFGAKRLPDTARALGKSMRILKSETSAMRNDGKTASPEPAQDGTAQQTVAPKTIQAAPGDVASARPVDEPKGTTQS